MKIAKYKTFFSLFSFNAKNAWQALIFLIAGFSITAGVAYNTWLEDNKRESMELRLVCDEIKTTVSNRLHAHALLLRSGAAYIAADDTVTRQDWQLFIERVKMYKNLPGVQGVGYTLIVPASQLEQHTLLFRTRGFPAYSIRPEGDRPVYTSIIYIEPFAGRNLRAFGYDMFSEPVRRKAMEQSRDSDEATLSGKVTLVQETNTDVQYGTLMYVPVYRTHLPISTPEQRRAAIKGWVYSPYRMDDLMQGILGPRNLGHNARVHLQIYEDRVSATSLLYNNQTDLTQNNDDMPSRTVSLPVTFGGKKWILHFTQSNVQSSVKSTVVLILGTGAVISLLFFALSLSFLSTRHRALQIAGQLTLELKESEERFKTLLNSAAEAIYGLDLQGRCTFSNVACVQILGVHGPEQLLGKNMHDLIHYAHSNGEPYAEQDCHIFKAFIKGEGTHIDNEVLWRANGSSFPAEYWSVPIIINGKIEGAVVTFFDITERIETLEKIKEARNEAENANRAKSEFLSRMSHELRTPLNSILGFSQLLEMDELNPGQRKRLGYIMHSGKHLLNLINEVLDISRIEAGQILLSLETVQVNPVIQEIIESIQTQLFARQISIELRQSPNLLLFVKSDRLRLKQILLNLTSNAIKYNKTGGSILIETCLMPVDAEGIAPVRISVTDTGIGIAPLDIPKLFIPFERIGAEKTETEGTGLGMTVVQKLMDAMGGTMGVESVQGVGTTFWVELPQAESLLGATPHSAALPAESRLPGKSGTVLYIEDNIPNIELIEEILFLQRPDIRLITHSLGHQAVALATQYRPDLILLDLNLPDIHGSEVMKLLGADEKTKAIPVVIISADAMLPQLQQLLKAGAKKYLTKPLNVIPLLAVIDEFIAGAPQKKQIPFETA